MKFLKIILLFSVFTITSYAQIGGTPGAFTRMGFGARGISMGNAMTSVTKGNVIGYYNPALSVFQNEHLVNLSYSFLSFDRNLNFISYTKNFTLPNQNRPGAGVTFSWLNAGVSDIDGRDIDGFHTDMLSVFENQFAFSPSIRFSDKFTAGIGFKFYYSKLYEGVSATSFGIDLGAVYSLNEKLNLGFTAKDINSKYEWNTADIYGQYGGITKEKFPNIYTIGLSYSLPNDIGLVSTDFQWTNVSSKIVRMGFELSPMQYFNFRGGVDRFDFNNEDKFGSSQFMFGIGYQRPVNNFIFGIDYSFVMEPFSNNPFQTLTAVLKIK